MSSSVLEQRKRSVLARMSVLSDAATTALGVSTAHVKPGTKAPKGPSRSLFDEWSERLEQERDEGRLRTLLLLAERDLNLRLKRKPLLIDDQGNREDTTESEERILKWFEGVPADEAAIMESASGTNCTTSYIRGLRARNERDPQDGLPVAIRRSRAETAERLKWSMHPPMSIRKIAAEMRVSKSTVERLLKQAQEQRGQAA